ncbi:MAG: GNAT family N-acetyltransferase [Methylophilaceae bacterium]|nr:GNAT family N-acetyltransferase [Methylophilaceae bacterium]
MIVNIVSWKDAGSALADIRRHVFIEEQSVPESLEWDGMDDDAVHVLALDATHAIGCARMLSGGRIGRMAVLPEWRGRGVGRAMLETLIALSREQGLAHVSLSAQTHAIPFYAKSGFKVCSEIYDDAGIPHRDMVLALST